jgi:hypothetical protein
MCPTDDEGDARPRKDAEGAPLPLGLGAVTPPPPSPGGVTPPPAAGTGTPPPPPSSQNGRGRWKWIPASVLLCLIVFVVASAIAAIENVLGTPPNIWWTYVPFFALIALSIAFGAWFITCFTGDPLKDDRTLQSFRFAYVFTMTSFAVLVFPMTNPWQPDILGPISLIRGCVDPKAEKTIPDAIACVEGSEREIIVLLDTPDEKKDTPDVKKLRQYKEPKGFSDERSYPWLIVIGGSYGVLMSAAKQPDKKTGTSNQPSFSIIQGGFVVPYYIVLLAFVGGAISLTRRIPEYQKQSEDTYVATTDAPKLNEYEARENVIFEIMQLITAPFIAMVAFYAFAPATTAGGITLAFLSGFSSSLILLQLRGMLEGLYPAATAKLSLPASTSPASQFGDVSGTVTDSQNQPLVGVNIEVQGQTGILPVQTDSQGKFQIPHVPVGQQVLKATSGGNTKSATLQIKAGSANSVNIPF